MEDKAHLVGVDVDPDIRKLAEYNLVRHGKSARLEIYNGLDLPFEESSFDKVFSCLVFHHLTTESKRHAAAELKRVLRPGGSLIVADWGTPDNLLMKMNFVLVRVFDGFKTTADNVRGRLPDIFATAGFQRVEEAGRINAMIGTLRYWNALA